MITPAYCKTMARYNAWQNDGLRKMIPEMDHAEVYQDRGAFFGSIMRTLNHLLWGDMLWMSRFDGGAAPDLSIEDSFEMAPTPAVWAADRFQMDARITLWAESIAAVDLVGDIAWYSGAMKRDMVRPKALCVMQLFNHQTHHRGQVHAMLTAAGQKPNDTDIPFMPEYG
ncbi:DinB family protein [Yoonia sediminilitoris]|uniref:Putative damage-inducible protein DinB n=1 Tax=Yoonia sediminilitoris TaxID=1286148 RepID=A0A2T6K9C3_9RHOB|nr:DinB family protein [Yoonia sediminilitoris]PUB11306.1 putative damage-inducible protein DinB [Yoonia sediminilitoris]RCW91122.1 putative damage-inducible protein DinB [Yoonia sediminilitoris]